MLSRRALLESGIAVSALGLVWAHASGRSAHSTGAPRPLGFGPGVVVIADASLAASEAFVAAAARLALPVFEFNGDAGGIWMNVLEPRLREQRARSVRAPRIAIAGLATPAASFALEYLAHSYGLAARYRVEHGPDERVAPMSTVAERRLPLLDLAEQRRHPDAFYSFLLA